MSVIENVAVILCRPKRSDNVGTAARAAANMGLGRLILIQPAAMDKNLMLAAATKAGRPLIENLEVHDDFESALAGFHFVVGTTARRGSDRGPFYTPGNLAEHILSMSRDNQVGLLFGPERTGLTTEELRHCQAVVTIPTADPAASSLNLSQAVLILGYELLLGRERQPRAPSVKPAPQEELEAMYGQLAQTLVTIGFLPDENTSHWLMSFKRIFNRSMLTHGECNLWRGVCRQIHWALNNPDKIKKNAKAD